MKTRIPFLLVCLLLIPFQLILAQGIGINTSGNPADPSAGLDVDFTDKGMLMPRLTTAQRDAISNPAYGLLIVNTDTDCLNMWNGNNWVTACFNCTIPAPSISSNSPVCAGASIQLTAATVSGATYSWTGPNGFTSSQQNPVIANATTAASGSYTLVVSTTNNCTSVPATLSLQVNANPVVTASSNGSVCTGDTLFLTATTISGATYNWTGPNGFSSSLQNPQITNIIPAIAGDYIVVATANGCASAPDTTSVTYGSNQNSSQTFNYSGAPQMFIVPQCANTVTLEVWGAQGGMPSGNYGGLGGYATGTLNVSQGDTLHVYVGGAGSFSGNTAVGGWNGGGGHSGSNPYTTGGGGASDIRVGGTTLNDRIIVGGGGGGSAWTYSSTGIGGIGGGLTGGDGGFNSNATDSYGRGGTQSAGGAPGFFSTSNNNPGSFGTGGAARNTNSGTGGAGAGGGGWYGGGGAAHGGGGGGGSSYLGGVNGGSTQSGVRSGNGQIIITW